MDHPHASRKDNPFLRLINRYPLASFVLMTFTISWVLWLGIWLSGKGIEIYTYPLFFIGAFGPFISAFALTYVRESKAGVVRLAKRLVQWRESLRWYAVALFLIPALMITCHRRERGARRPGRAFRLAAMVSSADPAGGACDRHHHWRPTRRGAWLERLRATKAAGEVRPAGRRPDPGHHLVLLAHTTVPDPRHIPEWLAIPVLGDLYDGPVHADGLDI